MRFPIRTDRARYRRLALDLLCPDRAIRRQIEAVRLEDQRRRGKARTKQIVVVR